MPGIVVQTDGHFAHWEASTLLSLGLKEADLEAAILAAPGPLVLDQLPLERLNGEVIAYQQRGLRAGSGQREIPDVILLTGDGEVVVLEVKRLGNPELRGRAVVSQVVGYATSLAATDEATLVGTLSRGTHRTWEALVRADFPRSARPDALAKRFRKRVADAELCMAIVCDEAPEALAEWVRAAGRLSALAFSIHVVEITPLVPHNATNPIAWSPALRVSTQIIHRTVVTVRQEGGAAVHVNVTTESAEAVAEAINPTAKPDRLELARAVLAPIAEHLHLTIDALWQELDAIHREALATDWSATLGELANPDASGVHLRGKAAEGFAEGRFGVDLLNEWKPGLFVGAYLLRYDHRQPLLAPEDGGDFALILDVLQNATAFDGDAFVQHALFYRLRERLARDSGAWNFADHLAQAKPNRWHPLYLRRPLMDVLGDASTPQARRDAWFAAARDAVQVLLQGGELVELQRVLGA